MARLNDSDWIVLRRLRAGALLICTQKNGSDKWHTSNGDEPVKKSTARKLIGNNLLQPARDALPEMNGTYSQVYRLAR